MVRDLDGLSWPLVELITNRERSALEGMISSNLSERGWAIAASSPATVTPPQYLLSGYLIYYLLFNYNCGGR